MACRRSMARPWVEPSIAGEASPYYLFHPLVAERLARDFPDVRLIVMLRDPVERAYSHYKERRKHGAEPLGFEEALAAEPDRLRGEADRIIREPGYRSVEHEDHSYLAQGLYLDMLERWFALFPRVQFHIAVSEEFYADPDRVVNGVWSFLGLPPRELRSRTRHNYIPAPGIQPATRQRLQSALAGHNRELERLLGRTLPWPVTSGPDAPDPAASGPPNLAEPRGQPMDNMSPASTQAGGTTARPATGWPSVTVIVATRDRPELLHRAVRSILGQSYPGDIECVVVFDQSAPRPMSVESSDGRRVRVLTNSRTPGLAGARNTGIVSSDSVLIAFCDDDDEWDHEKLSRQVERLPSAEFIACGVRIHYAGRVIARIPPPEVGLADLIRSRITAMHPSTFVTRRDALTGMGLVDEKIPGSYGEDYDFLLRAARRGLIVSIEQPLVDVYWHKQSFFAEGWAARASALQYLLGKHPEFAADRHGLARMQGRIAFAQAALNRRAAACESSWRAIRNNPLERRAYLALAVASGAIPATFIMRLANNRGLGI